MRLQGPLQVAIIKLQLMTSTNVTARLCLSLALLAAACTQGHPDVLVEPSTQSPLSSTAANSVADQASSLTNAELALDRAFRFATSINDYQHLVVSTQHTDRSLLKSIAEEFDPHISFDQEALGRCLDGRLPVTPPVNEGLFESTAAGFASHPADAGIMLVAYRLVQVVPENYDETTTIVVYIGPDGIIGLRDDGSAIASCTNNSLRRQDDVETLFYLAKGADLDNVGPLLQDQGTLVTSKGTEVDAANDASGTSDTDGASNAAGDSDRWTQRPGFAADPADPEPIVSTGTNKWDLIRVEDPSAFSNLVYSGQGHAEILDPTKSFYENVENAHLFVASFSDGTTISIRVHPEVGAQAEAETQVNYFTRPLGQLPPQLRAGIGRLSLRLGDETATASTGEGISMQIGNVAVRLGDDRLEETIFHEAVHTSLDATYAYSRSAEWLDAQVADGRFLTEYGREHPDSEDLAETALYVWALLNHNDRIPISETTTIANRIPNRIAFLSALLDPAG